MNSIETAVALGAIISSNTSDKEAASKWGQLVENLGEDKLYELCEKLDICSMVYARIESLGGFKFRREEWKDRYLNVKRSISGYFDAARIVSALLKDASCDVFLLKNSGIAYDYNCDLGTCPMGDVDMLVDIATLDEAMRVLVSHGFKLHTDEALENNLITPYEYEFKYPEGDREIHFELQTRAVSGRWLSEEKEPTYSELCEHSHWTADGAFKVFNPEMALLLVCLHTAKHSYVRSPGFRLNTDVDRIIANTVLDWSVFLNLVSRYEVRVPVFFSLYYANLFLAAPVPSSVLDSLKPSRLRFFIIDRFLNFIGFLEPKSKRWNKINFIFFVLFLFDGPGDLIRGAFPDLTRSRTGYADLYKKYGLITHLIRIKDLLLRRKLS